VEGQCLPLQKTEHVMNLLSRLLMYCLPKQIFSEVGIVGFFLVDK